MSSVFFINPIYIKLAKLAMQGSVIRYKAGRVRIPVVKFEDNGFIFFLLEGRTQEEVNMNMKLYDFFTNRGIYPSLIGGYFVIEKLSELLEVVDRSSICESRFESSTAHEL
jgi:hypothetical protein